MAVIESAGNGTWHTPATWVGGAVPGTGDSAVIKAGHEVIVFSPVTAIWRITVYGTLNIQNNILLDDASGAYIWCTTAGVITNTATRAAPLSISSAGGANPTYLWYFTVHNGATARRTVNLKYISMSGNWWYFGTSSSDGYYVSFNSRSDRFMLRPTPVSYELQNTEHIIDGRSRGRFYWRGNTCGRTTVRGYLPMNNFYHYETMENLKLLGLRVALTTDLVHLPQARIESLRWGEPKGNNLPFTMVLVEDL